jgi:hypothetical protein
MKTEELVTMLAKGSGAVDATPIAVRYTVAILAGGMGAIALMSTVLGMRHDIGDAIRQPMFALKIAYVVALAAAGVFASVRLSRPGARRDGAWVAIAVPIVVIWAVALAEWSSATPEGRYALLFGSTWRSCPWLIAMLAIPLFVAMLWAMAGLAPTDLRLAGAVAGFASGALATVVYSAHCPELAAPFLGVWYIAGIAVPTVVGSLLGPRFLRW